MKTRLIFILFATFCFSLSIFADGRETIKFSNVEQNENGCTKEFVFCDKETNAPLTKTVYKYDNEGRMQEKSSYEWNGNKGWIGLLKTAYNYDENSASATPIAIKWDKRTNNWTK